MHGITDTLEIDAINWAHDSLFTHPRGFHLLSLDANRINAFEIIEAKSFAFRDRASIVGRMLI